MKIKIDIPEKVKNIMKHLISHDYQAYIVGGAIRDYFLGIKPHDWDLFTNCPGDNLLNLFQSGNIIGGKERQEKILTLIVDDIEVSQYRSSGDRTETKANTTIEEHLGTCDYNVNAIACDINGNIIDLYQGVADIKHRRFEFVGNCQSRIDEDPLRLMRGVRLLLQHKLRPGLETETFIEENGHKLKALPQERIRDELMKIISYPNCYDILKELNMLEYVLPELYALIGLDAGPHHKEKDCFEHSNIAHKNACKLTKDKLLIFGIGLHDIGKKTSAKIIDGEITFHNHQMDSERLVHKLMTRLKFSKNQISYVGCIVKQHMMGPVKKMRNSTFAKIADDIDKSEVLPEDLVIMTYSDNQANLNKPRLSFHQFIKENPFLRKYYEFKYGRKPFNKNDLEINGNDLINIGIKPGPIIGKILNNIFEAVHNGDVINRRDRLMEYIKKWQ